MEPKCTFLPGNAEWGFEEHVPLQWKPLKTVFSWQIIKSSENKGGGGRPQLLQIQQYGFYWECELKCGGWRRWERRSACPGNIYTILWAGLGLVFCPEHSVLLHYYSHSPQPCLVFRTRHCHSCYLVCAIDSTKDPLQWLGHSVQCSLLNYANQPKSSISEIKQPPNTASVQAVSNLFLQIFICIQTSNYQQTTCLIHGFCICRLLLFRILIENQFSRSSCTKLLKSWPIFQN